MALPTFTPPVTPSIGLTDKPEIKVRRAEFGDGYSQATADGLNHIRRVVSIRWDVLALEEAEEILAFFKARGGHEPFLYPIPREPAPVKWTCAEWSSTHIKAGFLTIEATFRQDFGLST